MDTNSFIIDIKTEDFSEDISNDVDNWFDTSDYDKNEKKPLPIGINKKVIGMFKDQLNGKIMKEFCTLRAKTCFFIRWWDRKKRANGTKKCVIKRNLAFENVKNSLFNAKIVLITQLGFKSDHHKVYTEEINKIAPRSNDNKMIQTFDNVTTHPYGTSDFKICESQMLSLRK